MSIHRQSFLFPLAAIKLNDLVSQLQQCYQLTTAGKFSEAIERLQRIAQCVPLLHVDAKAELAEAQQLLAIAKEYLLGLHMETARKGNLRICSHIYIAT